MTQVIRPAELLPGVDVKRIPGPERADGPRSQAGAVIRGRALIFWDPKVPGKKLDAIDTDQITPANDCVSESLDTLDHRWKAGSFRFLMPDFRERVRRGESFIVAGDRFAIGSSREMSPAGLKGVGDDGARPYLHRADPVGTPGRQGRRGARRRDAAALRRPAAGLRRHRAVLDPHLQPDHGWRHDPAAADRRSQ